jgi:trehalose utilization protein
MKYYWLTAVALIGLLATAQSQSPSSPTNAVPPAPLEWGPGVKVLSIGGTWAHNYALWDNKFDTELLAKAGITSVHYTESPAVAASELPHADVLLLSCNGDFDEMPFRVAVSNFVNAGKGLVLLHSGSFYAGKWAGFYTAFVGGGAHDHDGPSQFDETVVKDHPVVHGLPATFKITDELYHIVPEPGASPMDVLAYASRPGGGQKYPSVWLVPYGNARIVSIALGHDGFPRKSPEFSMLLTNAVKWAAGQ